MKAYLTPLPPREAIAAMRRRGATLSPSFAWQDVWQDEHQARFTVAKSTGFDILADIRDAVEDAIADGGTLAGFQDQLQPVLEARGWWGKREVRDPQTGEIVTAQLGSARRLQTIFETNMRTAYAQGHWARFEREKAERPWLRYVALMDGRTRPEHAARHNVCLPVDHPFWDTWAPPCGWGCRCTLQSLSDRDVERLRRDGVPLVLDPPPDRMSSYVNPRTGETHETPEGIDPGWAYNPGKTSLASAHAIERVLAGPSGWTSAALEAMPENARVQAYRQWMTALLDGRNVDIAALPAGRLGRNIVQQSGIDDDASWIVMTARTAASEIARGTEAGLLLRAPQLLANPLAVLEDLETGDLVYLVSRTAGQWVRIVVRPGGILPGQKDVQRAVVRNLDRVPLDTYPNPATHRLIAGALPE